MDNGPQHWILLSTIDCDYGLFLKRSEFTIKQSFFRRDWSLYKDFLNLQYEQVQKLCRMECLWRLFSHWRQDRYCPQPHPPVFYLYIPADNGLPDHYLYDPCFLEKYTQLRKSGQKKSVVLFVGGMVGGKRLVGIRKFKSNIIYSTSLTSHSLLAKPSPLS